MALRCLLQVLGKSASSARQGEESLARSERGRGSRAVETKETGHGHIIWMRWKCPDSRLDLFPCIVSVDKHSLVLTIYLHPAGSPMLSSKTSAKELNIHGLLILQSCKPKKAGESVSWCYQSAFQPCDHQPNWGPVTLWGRVAYYVPVNQSWFCIFFYWLFIRQQLGSFQVLGLRTFPHSALWNTGPVACMKQWNADWETWNASEDFWEMCSTPWICIVNIKRRPTVNITSSIA